MNRAASSEHAAPLLDGDGLKANEFDVEFVQTGFNQRVSKLRPANI